MASESPPQIDHVLLLVRDFESAAERLQQEHGLVALPGGAHPGGTCNWIVNLEAPQYLELLGVADAEKLSASPRGRWLLSELERGDHLLTWALRTESIDAVAKRTGRAPIDGFATDADGDVRGGWRTIAAPPESAGALPFFIQYNATLEETIAGRRQSYEAAASPAVPGRIRELELSVDEDKLRAWTGAELPVRVVAGGRPGIRAVRIASARGEIVIR